MINLRNRIHEVCDIVPLKVVRNKKIRKAKFQHELSLVTMVKDNNNNKRFYKYINGKKSAKESLHPLLDARGNMTMRIRKRLRSLMPSLHLHLLVRPLFPGVLSIPNWKSRTGRRRNPSQFRWKQLESCCSTWTVTSAWGQMGSTQWC